MCGKSSLRGRMPLLSFPARNLISDKKLSATISTLYYTNCNHNLTNICKRKDKCGKNRGKPGMRDWGWFLGPLEGRRGEHGYWGGQVAGGGSARDNKRGVCKREYRTWWESHSQTLGSHKRYHASKKNWETMFPLDPNQSMCWTCWV